MEQEDIRQLYGWATIAPDTPITAGSTGTWQITYHTGRRGIDDGGVVKIAWRDVSDWATPQFDDPAAPNYASVTTTGPATLKARFERQRYVRPWRYCVTIDVFDDSLAAGETITLTLGDTSGGSPGSRAQTFCKESFEFRVAVDWCGTWVYSKVPSPAIPIISGPPTKLVVLGPSQVIAGEKTWIGIKAEDLWGNPCTQYSGTVHIQTDGIEGLPETYHFGPEDRGVHRFEAVQAPRAGTYSISAADRDNNIAATGNPLEVLDTPKTWRPFWGDLHGQSEETVGTNPVSSYFTFARDAALVDFAGHQGNDFQITAAVWDEIRHQANAHNQPGRFVGFVGYEWSGNTPLGGDHNVYYPGDDGPLHRSSHVLIPDKSDLDTDCTHIEDLYATLKDQDALLVPHVGGRYANLEWHDPQLEALVEVYSEWGEFEWFLREALEKGYRVGFTAGSDDHKGRPGAAYPGSGSFGVLGGLTCVWATDLSRASLWQALKARRCYGTTGQRILLEVSADGQPMGADLKVDTPPQIQVRALGTAPIERIDLFRGLDCIYTFPESTERAADKVRLAWSGQRIRARNRLVRWDGSLTLDRGRILTAEGYAFDSAAEGLEEIAERKISWNSVTTGDADGVVLHLDAPPETVLSFDTPVLRRQFTLAQIAAGPIVEPAGGIDMQVVFENLPLSSGPEASFTFQDTHLEPGTHPYWVRLVQTDGAKAWTSPIYVEI